MCLVILVRLLRVYQIMLTVHMNTYGMATFIILSHYSLFLSSLAYFSLLSPLFLSLLGVSCLTIQTLAQYITMSIIPMTIHVSLSLLHVFDDVCMILLPVQVCMYIMFVSFLNDVVFTFFLHILSCACTVRGNCVIMNACTVYAVLSVTFWYMFLYPFAFSFCFSLFLSHSSIVAEVHLYMQKNPYTSATRTEFDAKFGVHDDFLMLDRYIFAQV